MAKIIFTPIIITFILYFLGCSESKDTGGEVIGRLNGEDVHLKQVLVDQYAEQWNQLRDQQRRLKREAFANFVRQRALEIEAKSLGVEVAQLYEPFTLLKNIAITDEEISKYLKVDLGQSPSPEQIEKIHQARVELAKKKYVDELVQRLTVSNFIGDTRAGK